MDVFEKQPSEKFVFSIDFSNNLSTNETITSKTITGYLNENDITSQIIDDSSIDDEGKIIYIKVMNGTNLIDYKITALVNTSDDNIFEKDVLMMIREV
jgi:hypothetical protein